jgi:hypothetical protein
MEDVRQNIAADLKVACDYLSAGCEPSELNTSRESILWQHHFEQIAEFLDKNEFYHAVSPAIVQDADGRYSITYDDSGAGEEITRYPALFSKEDKGVVIAINSDSDSGRERMEETWRQTDELLAEEEFPLVDVQVVSLFYVGEENGYTSDLTWYSPSEGSQP